MHHDMHETPQNTVFFKHVGTTFHQRLLYVIWTLFLDGKLSSIGGGFLIAIF